MAKAEDKKPKELDKSPILLAMGKRIRWLRVARGFSQGYVDEQAGLSNGTTCRIEKGDRAKSGNILSLAAIARVVGGDIGWLLTEIVPDGRWEPPKKPKNMTPKPGRPRNEE